MKTERMVRVSSKGQIVLPKRLRDKLDFHEGDYLIVDELSDGLLVIGKPSRALFDLITEPIKRDLEVQGFTREELMDMIKSMRAQPEPDEA